MKDKYKQVETIVSWIISLTGFIILGFTIKVTVTNYKEMNSIDLIISFILPILLSTLYLPITYLFALYAKYSHLFKLLKYRKSLKKQDKENYRIKLVQKGKFPYDKVRRLVNILNNRSNLNLEEKEFSQLVDRFK